MAILGYTINLATEAVNYLAWSIVECTVSYNISPAATLQVRIYALRTIYSLLKWILHHVSQASQIVRISKSNNIIDENLCVQSILGQLLASRKLHISITSFLGERDTLQLLRSILSIKKIDPEKEPISYRLVTRATGILGGIYMLGQDIDEMAHKEAKQMEQGDKLLYETYESIRDCFEKNEEKFECEWVNLGFQGTDPYRDFRGTGQFGLQCFHYFCTTYPMQATKIIKESRSSRKHDCNSKPWYSFALVSIHISQYVLNLVDSNYLYKLKILRAILLEGNDKKEVEETKILDIDNYSFNTIQRLMVQVLILHSRLVIEFHSYWMTSVRQGVVKSVLDTEEALTRFKHLAQHSKILL